MVTHTHGGIGLLLAVEKEEVHHVFKARQHQHKKMLQWGSFDKLEFLLSSEDVVLRHVCACMTCNVVRTCMHANKQQN